MKFVLRNLAASQFRLLLASTLLTFPIAPTHAGKGSPLPAQIQENDELAVWAAAVQQLYRPSSQGWIMLADHTVSFACESGDVAGFSAGDCSGMRTHDQTPAEVLSWVREQIPAVAKQLTNSLAQNASATVFVNRPMPLETRQIIWGPTSSGSVPAELGSPDFALYPSRVGFNAGRNAALVYLGVVNWADASKSFGEYVFLSKAEGRWTVKGRARLWQLGS